MVFLISKLIFNCNCLSFPSRIWQRKKSVRRLKQLKKILNQKNYKLFISLLKTSYNNSKFLFEIYSQQNKRQFINHFITILFQEFSITLSMYFSVQWEENRIQSNNTGNTTYILFFIFNIKSTNKILVHTKCVKNCKY